MRVQVRRGLWETNSSSAHTICVTKNYGRMTQQEIRDEFYLLNNILTVSSDNHTFGWGFEILRGFRSKLKYALASYCGDCHTLKSYDKSEEEFLKVFRPLLLELVGVDDVDVTPDSRDFNIYSDTITEDEYQSVNTYEEVPYDDLIYIHDRDIETYPYSGTCKSGRKMEKVWFDVMDFGGIDHQSAGLLQGFLKKYNISLEDFLVRKDIVVIIDNDNSCILSDMIEAGLVNMDNINIKYPYSGSYDWEKYKQEHPELFDKNGEWIDKDEGTD